MTVGIISAGRRRSSASPFGPYSFQQALLGNTGLTTMGGGAGPWNVEDFDTGSIHDTVTNNTRIVAPHEYLRIIASFGNNSGASPWRQSTTKGVGAAAHAGRMLSIGYNNSAYSSQVASTAIIRASLGDFYEVHADSGNIATKATTWCGVETFDPTLGIALCWNSVQQAMTSGSWVTLSWDDHEFDTKGVHSKVTNNSRITPGITGLVRLGAMAANNFTGAVGVRIRMNGTTVVASDSQNQGVDGAQCWSRPVAVTPTDYFEVQVWTDTASRFAIGGSTGSWFCYEELDPALKYCVATLAVGGDSVGVNTSEAILWGDELIDTHGSHSTVTNTDRMTVPSGAGITQARLSYNIEHASGASRLLFMCNHVVNGRFRGNVEKGVISPGLNLVNGFGAWFNVTPGDAFNIACYSGVSRTFSASDCNWFCMEYR